MVPETINRPTILIVDDGVEIIEVLVELLAKNHEIIFSTTGLQALKLVAATPDLILLDINMPDMDGYSVCQEINKERGQASDKAIDHFRRKIIRIEKSKEYR